MGAIDLGFAITQLALKYGVPLAVQLAHSWSEALVNDPTKEDFERLREMVPAAETYFQSTQAQ